MSEENQIINEGTQKEHTEEERQEELKRIEPFKTYDEYTEEEKKILPPLPEDAERIKNRESYVWTGFCWDIEYRGW